MYLSHDGAIADADWIARVRPLSIDRNVQPPVYTLKVLEYVKGNGPDLLTIDGSEPGGGHGFIQSYVAMDDEQMPADANHFGHEASSFWRFGGRANNEPDCEIYPAFAFGGPEYLVFGPKGYNVGFENVISDGDAWLAYVRMSVAGREATPPTSITDKEYLDRAEAVVLIEQFWADTRVQTNVEILKGPAINYLSMLHAAPYAEAESILRPECRAQKPYLKDRDPVRKRLVVFEFMPTDEIRLSDGFDCAGGDLKASVSVFSYGLYSRNGHSVYEVREEKILPEFDRFNTVKLLEGLTIADVRRLLTE